LRRDVDIIADLGGRTVHAEVKTNIGTSPDFKEGQIIKDLVRHAPEGYADLLYLYHPSVRPQLPALERKMLNLFDRADVKAQFKGSREWQQARKDFVQWLKAGNVTTYSF
jgi:hypothetical protein